MIEPSIDRINQIAPYTVQKGKVEYSYGFKTDAGIQYSISFMPDFETLQLDDCFEFIIANLNNQKSPLDRKLRDTVVAIINEFFRLNNSVLLYICETGDGKQAMRNRLFHHWFSSNNQKGLFTILNSSVKADGIINYATLIIRNDNPRLGDVVKRFTDTVQLLSEKPQ